VNPENVRENVRELGTKPAETSLKQSRFCADFIGSFRLACVGVYRNFPLRTRRSGVRISQGAPLSSPSTS